MYVTLSILLFSLSFSLSCLRGVEDIPSRVAIVDSDGIERTDFFLLPGMTQRLQAGAFVATLAGEQFIGAPEASGFLGGSAFQQVDGDSFVTTALDGCVIAKAPGRAIVKLAVESVARGVLEAFSRVHVVSALQTPNRFLGGGIKDVSVTSLRTRFRERLTAMVTEGGNGDLVFHVLNEQGLATRAALPLVSSGAGEKPKVLADETAEAFFIGFAKRTADPQKFNFSIVEIDSRGIEKNIATSQEQIPMRNVEGGIVGGIPAFFSIAEAEALKFKIFIFSATASGVVATGFLTDPVQRTSIEIVLNNAELPNLLGIAQFRQDRAKQFHILLGKDGAKNQLKLISFDPSLQMKSELIPQATPDQPHAFSWDIFSGTPKIIFVQGERLLFAEKRSGNWIIQFATPLAEGVDGAIQPRLVESREDGTLVAVWKEKNNAAIHFRISRDGGKNWSLPFFHPSVAFPSGLDGIPSSCGGSVLAAVEQNRLGLKFFDDIRKSSVTFPLVSIEGILKKIVHFREADGIKLFYMDDAGLHLLVIP